MKILFVNFTTFWGGGEQWTFEVMTELQKRDHEIILLSNSPSELANKAASHNFRTISTPVKKFSFLNFFFLLRLRNIVSKINPEVVLINSTFELKSVGFVLDKNKIDKIIFNRGIPKKLRVDLIKRYLFNHVVTDVIVNSNYVKRSLNNLSKYLKNEPNVIYHGIHAESNVQANHTTKNIAIVGRLSHEKGVDYALKIMEVVLRSEPKAMLHVIGDGKEMSTLKKLASTLGISKSVIFHGFTNNVEELLLECSMLIMTSRWEGFGLVLLEAMKLQMPCISFDHIAANEIINDGQSGFLIPDMNTELFANRIVELLTDGDKCAKMGESAYRLLNIRFNISRSIDFYENIILSHSND